MVAQMCVKALEDGTLWEESSGALLCWMEGMEKQEEGREESYQLSQHQAIGAPHVAKAAEFLDRTVCRVAVLIRLCTMTRKYIKWLLQS